MTGKQRNMNVGTIARLRMTVQASFCLSLPVCGYRFYQFYSWAIGQSETFVSRPPAVEGFLPISALLWPEAVCDDREMG